MNEKTERKAEKISGRNRMKKRMTSMKMRRRKEKEKCEGRDEEVVENIETSVRM